MVGFLFWILISQSVIFIFWRFDCLLFFLVPNDTRSNLVDILELTSLKEVIGKLHGAYSVQCTTFAFETIEVELPVE